MFGPVPADVIGQPTAGAAQPGGAATEAGTAAAAGQQQDAETVAPTARQQTNSQQNESENVVGQAQAATDFIPAPDGGLDYGEITPEMGRAMRRQAGKIRLRQGNEAWGLTHIRNRHLDQFQRLGFDSAEAFVASVAADFTAIYQRPGSALDVVFAESGTGQRLAVQLEPSVDGDFYDVKTASPVRADQFKNKKPLWERAGTSTPTAMESSPPSPRSQSGSASVPLAAVDAKAAKPAAIEETRQGDDGNGAMFSRNDAKPVTNPTAVKMRRAMVQRTVDALAKGWAKAPNVTVVDGMQDERVPEAVRKADAAQRSQGAMGEPEGFWYRGQVYLVVSALPTSADAARVLYHEVLGHHGLRGHFGKDFDRVLDQVIKLRRKDVQAKAQEYGLDMSNPEHAGYAAEEVLAELAQSRPDLGFVQRAIAAIRNFLRTHVPGFKVLELTDADIVQGYLLPARGWVERGGVSSAVNGDTRFSFAGERANTADTMALATAKQRLDAGENAEIVRQETGWHKGADGKWRFEISDADAKYIGKEAMEQAAENDPYKMAEMRLEEVLDHPALFAAYPGLRDVSVAYEASSAADGDLYYGANYNAEDNVITIGNGLDEATQLSALLHEIQHGIQNIEGFATGGNEDSRSDVMQAVSQQRSLWADVYAVRRDLDAGKKLETVLAEWQDFLDAQPSAEALRIAQDPELEMR